MKKLTAAFIIQPNTINSGGGYILQLIHDIVKNNLTAKLVHLRPQLKLSKRDLKLVFKFYLKKLLSFIKTGNISIATKTVDSIRECDIFFVGWVGDVAMLLEAGVEPEKIVHICQSIETWGGSIKDCDIAYRTPLVRWFVASWMSHDIVECLHPSQVIGNSINSIFHTTTNTEISDERIYVTYLSHPGWWKNTTECALEARFIAKLLELQTCEFGAKGTGFSDIFFRNPKSEQVKKILNKTKIFLSLSFYEGMPLVVLEAISSGCFAFLSDIPAHREIASLFPNNTLIIKSSPISFSENDLKNILKDCPSSLPENINYFKESNFINRVENAINTTLSNKFIKS